MEEKELQAAAEQPTGDGVPPPEAAADAVTADTPTDGAIASAPEDEPVDVETVPDEVSDETAESIETQYDDDPTRETVAADELLGETQQPGTEDDSRRAELKAVLEAIVYVLNEPMPAAQIAQALGRETAEVEAMLRELADDTSGDQRGVFIREVAGGYQMATKPEHHDVIRQFVKNLKQPLKLSQAALETLAVIAYKQPITLPEILEIRGVQGGGVLKTLLDRKLVTTAGRKNVIGKPILYKTTKEFLTQFGLKDVGELPSLKEFEEIRRQSMADDEVEPVQQELPVGETPDEFDAQQLEQAQESAEAAEEQAAEPANETAAAAEESPAEQQSETAEQPEEDRKSGDA